MYNSKCIIRALVVLFGALLMVRSTREALQTPIATTMSTIMPMTSFTTMNRDVLLMAGGSTTRRSVEILDPHGTCQIQLEDLPDNRKSHSINYIDSGEVLICGGSGGGNAAQSCLIFDEQTKRFKHHSDLPIIEMEHVGLELNQTLWLVENFSEKDIMLKLEGNKWEIGYEQLEHPSRWSCAIAVNETTFIVIGGIAGHQKPVRSFSTETRQWRILTPMNSTDKHLHSCLFIPPTDGYPMGRVMVQDGVTYEKAKISFDHPIEMYDVFLDTWEMVGKGTNEYSGRMFLLNGRILRVGGKKDSHELIDTIQELHLGSYTWTTIDMKLNKVGGDAAGTVIPRYKVCPEVLLMAGGSKSKRSVEILDPHGTCQIQLKDLPDDRVDHSINYLDSGEILICGGAWRGTTPRSCLIFDEQTKRFKHHSDLPIPEIKHVGLVLNQTLWLVENQGGKQSSHKIMLKIEGNKWEIGYEQLKGPNKYSCSVAVNDITFIVIGGIRGKNEPVRSFSTETRQWRSLTPMPSKGRHLHSCLFIPPTNGYQMGRIMVQGGVNFGGGRIHYLESVEMYDVFLDTWERVGKGTKAYFGKLFLVNGRILLVGGKDDRHNHIDTIQEFHLGNYTWTTTGMKLNRVGGEAAGTVIPRDKVCSD